MFSETGLRAQIETRGAKGVSHTERSREIQLRNLKGNFNGIPRLTLGMTGTAV
jgi:hypothetical protein